MELKRIVVTTISGQVISFHANVGNSNEGEDPTPWIETDDLFIFQKLSKNDISFVKRNVISIDVNNSESNANGATTTE